MKTRDLSIDKSARGIQAEMDEEKAKNNTQMEEWMKGGAHGMVAMSTCMRVSFYMVPNWCFHAITYFTHRFFFLFLKSLFQILFKFNRFTYSAFSTHLSFPLIPIQNTLKIQITIIARDTIALWEWLCVKGCMSMNARERETECDREKRQGERMKEWQPIPEWIKSNENNSRLSNEMVGTQRQRTLCDCQWQYQQLNHWNHVRNPCSLFLCLFDENKRMHAGTHSLRKTSQSQFVIEVHYLVSVFGMFFGYDIEYI